MTEKTLDNYYYSPTKKGFYLPSVHGDMIPADALELSRDEHLALMIGQENGNLIVPDANGKPVLVDPPPPGMEELKALQVAVIVQAFDVELAKGFMTSLNIKMDCKQGDCAKFKDGYDLVEFSGETTMLIRDYNNVNHDNVPIATAKQVMVETAKHTRTQWLKKNTLCDQIQAATTPDQVAAVVWEA